jgi:hypothetical protein
MLVIHPRHLVHHSIINAIWQGDSILKRTSTVELRLIRPIFAVPPNIYDTFLMNISERFPVVPRTSNNIAITGKI